MVYWIWVRENRISYIILIIKCYNEDSITDKNNLFRRLEKKFRAFWLDFWVSWFLISGLIKRIKWIGVKETGKLKKIYSNKLIWPKIFGNSFIVD